MTATDIDGGTVTEVGGRPVHYFDRGTGEAVVLLHGGGPGATGWVNWSQNIDPLAERLRVIVPDLPGFGESGIGDVGAGYLSFVARTVAGLLEQLGVGRFHIVGNSLGGGTALTLALESPELVDRLILLNPAGSPASLFAAEPGAEMKMLMTYYDDPGPSYEKMLAFCQEMVFDHAVATPEFVQERYEESIAPGPARGPADRDQGTAGAGSPRGAGQPLARATRSCSRPSCCGAVRTAPCRSTRRSCGSSASRTRR